MKDLPRFKTLPRDQVIAYVSEMLTNERLSSRTHFRDLVEYADGHYRALFDRAYFALPEGQAEASRSQWNSLKKKMKRHERSLFIFKEHGEAPCDSATGEPCYYIDFGFFTEPVKPR